VNRQFAAEDSDWGGGERSEVRGQRSGWSGGEDAEQGGETGQGPPRHLGGYGVRGSPAFAKATAARRELAPPGGPVFDGLAGLASLE
jgi:hypothetical protein